MRYPGNFYDLVSINFQLTCDTYILVYGMGHVRAFAIGGNTSIQWGGQAFVYIRHFFRRDAYVFYPRKQHGAGGVVCEYGPRPFHPLRVPSRYPIPLQRISSFRTSQLPVLTLAPE